MPTLLVKIKHAGKVYDDVELNTDAPASIFKQTVYERTGVPVDRMKVMVKGGVLKVTSKNFIGKDTWRLNIDMCLYRMILTGKRLVLRRYTLYFGLVLLGLI